MFAGASLLGVVMAAVPASSAPPLRPGTPASAGPAFDAVTATAPPNRLSFNTSLRVVAMTSSQLVVMASAAALAPAKSGNTAMVRRATPENLGKGRPRAPGPPE